MAKFTRDSISKIVGSKVEAFNKKHNLISTKEFILVGCSGNADSVFAVYYLIQNGYKIAIAHIDHLTRNGQSTKDADFVQNLAKKLNVPFHLKTINIKELISIKGNFQEVARNERYSFFDELIKEYSYTKVITAHHGDDSVETLLMNLGRAGGLKAWKGIPPKSDRLVRPFLCLRKNEIQTYLELHQIDFRLDRSNLESEYKRNYFRNEVLPVIEKKQNNWVDKTMESIEFMSEIEQEFNHLSNQLLTKKDYLHSISIDKLLQKRNPHLYLFNLLSPYGFNIAQVNEILKSNQVGKKWKSEEYLLFRERNSIEFFLIDLIKSNQTYHLNEDVPRIGSLTLNRIKKESKRLLIPADIDESQVIIRHKQDGDFVQFKNNSKKLKKIFNEAKWSNYQKLNSWVVANGKQVLWIENLQL